MDLMLELARAHISPRPVFLVTAVTFRINAVDSEYSIELNGSNGRDTLTDVRVVPRETFYRVDDAIRNMESAR